MKLAGIAIVRDEADIIEPFVRHNLTFLDKLYLIDDGSCDATLEIIEQLLVEGLPLEKVEDGSHGVYYQGTRTTRLLAHAMAERAWDFVFPLDADEFIATKSRAALEEDLSRIPEGSLGGLNPRHYFPVATDDPAIANPVERLTHIADHAPYVFKVIVPRALALRPDLVVGDGNHRAHLGDGPDLPTARLKATDLAHFPVRSPAQLVAKCLVGTSRARARHDHFGNFNLFQIDATRILSDEKDLTPVQWQALLLAYEPLTAKPLVSRPFQEWRGRVSYPDLSGTYPYRRILSMVDGLVAEVRAKEEENKALRKELLKVELGPLSYFVHRQRRSFAKKWGTLVGSRPRG